MDCNTCNQLLLELVYDELDEVRAASVRKHVEGCADCKSAMDKMERGLWIARQLPRETAPAPSPALQAALAAFASGNLVAAATPPMNASDNLVRLESARAAGQGSAKKSGFGRMLDRLGEVAMRRQVAMAAVFLMMIGVGLVYYQTHPRPTGSEVKTTDVVPAQTVAVAPSPEVAANAPRDGMPTTVNEQAGRPTQLAQRVAIANTRSESSSLAASSPPVVPAVAGAQPVVTREPSSETRRQITVAMRDTTDQNQDGIAEAETLPAEETVAARERARTQVNDELNVESQSIPVRPPPMVQANTAVIPGDNRQAFQPTAGNAIPNTAPAPPPTVVANVDDPIAVQRRALALATDDASRARVIFALAPMLAQAGQLDEARSLLSRVHGTPDVEARARAMIANYSGRPGEQNTNSVATSNVVNATTNVSNMAGRTTTLDAETNTPTRALPLRRRSATTNRAVSPAPSNPGMRMNTLEKGPGIVEADAF